MLKKEQQEIITLEAKLQIIKKMLNRLDYPECAKAIQEAEDYIKELENKQSKEATTQARD